MVGLLPPSPDWLRRLHPGSFLGTSLQSAISNLLAARKKGSLVSRLFLHSVPFFGPQTLVCAKGQASPPVATRGELASCRCCAALPDRKRVSRLVDRLSTNPKRRRCAHPQQRSCLIVELSRGPVAPISRPARHRLTDSRVAATRRTSLFESDLAPCPSFDISTPRRRHRHANSSLQHAQALAPSAASRFTSHTPSRFALPRCRVSFRASSRGTPPRPRRTASTIPANLCPRSQSGMMRIRARQSTRRRFTSS